MTVAVIDGVGHWLPDEVVTSREMEARVRGASSADILPPGLVQMVSGVKTRRHAPPDMASSDLAARATLAALADAGTDPGDIDLLVFASASHDVSEPATANIVQQKTGCLSAACVDVKNACNSFLSGLDFAASIIETGRAGRVVVCAGEVISPSAHMAVNEEADLLLRTAGLTLGDAGAAFVLTAAPEGSPRRVYPGMFHTDGQHWDLSTILGGGSLMRHDTSKMFFECRSSQLQQVALDLVPPLMDKAISAVGWAWEDVDLIVPHQVSMAIIKAVMQTIGLPMDRAMVTLDRFGNTAAASIPLAFSTAISEGRLHPGSKVILVGGAAGFSAGVLPIAW